MEELRQFLIDKGYDFAPEHLDGEPHDFRTSAGQKGWYIGSKDNGALSLTFCDWRDSDVKHTFSSNKKLSPLQLKKLGEKAASRKEEQQIITKGFVAKILKKMSETPSLPPNEYWLKKKLPLDTQVYFKNGDGGNQSIAVIPMRDFDGDIWNIQYIGSDGQKNFQSGGRIKGLFNVVSPFCEDDTIYLGEGYATTLSFYLATGESTVACFSASNIKNVIKEFIDHGYKPEQLIVLADWDGGNAPHIGNTGMIEVQKIRKEFGVRAIYPWGGLHSSSYDFSDMWVNGWSIEKSVAAIDVQDEFDYIEQKKLAVAALKRVQKEAKETIAITHLVVEPQVLLPPVMHETDSSLIPEYDLSNLKLPDFYRGKPQATLKNFEVLMRFVGAELRYNVIKKEQDWILPNESASLDNRKRVIYARIMDLCRRLDMPVSEVDRYLDYLCDRNQFNPVKTWIESREWDGTGRLGEFFATVKSSDEVMKDLLIRKWMIGAVAAAYRPQGLAAPGVLVFQGAQGIGKTKWFKRLVPHELELTDDGKILRPDDKDSVKQIISYWLVELGELDATFKKNDIAQLKAFITKETDVLRTAYARQENVFPRRTMFFGSVNRREFLADDTGNRRFWVIECSGIDYNHSVDMQQVWAEIAELYKKGESWWLGGDFFDKVNQSNEDFTVLDPIEEKIRETYDWDEALRVGNWERKTIGEVLSEIGIDRPNRYELNGCAAVIRKLSGGIGWKKSNGKKLFSVPKKWNVLKMPVGVSREGEY